MSITLEQKQIAAALRALDRKQLVQAFDAYRPDTRPNKKQLEVLRDLQRIPYRYVVAGNQCMPKDTLISTPNGPKKIQNIKVNDTVYDENGKQIKVEKVFDNGIAEVTQLLGRGMVWGESTLNHTWLTCNSSQKGNKKTELTLDKFVRDTQVVRKPIAPPLGKVNEPHAYIIGALLGDGCSRSSGILLSSPDNKVPKYVAKQLGCELSEPKSGYTWRIKGAPKINHYETWCRGRYAHEKTCDLEVIKTWNRESLVKYVAGLIDTDGTVFVNKSNNVVVAIEMQAKKVIESLKYAMLALWQTPVLMMKRDREKHVNGPTYVIAVSSNAFSLRILKEITPYLQTTRKQYKPKYDKFVSTRSDARKVKISLGKTRKVRTYDIRVASEKSLYLTATGLVTHNSGKSQLAAKEVAWLVTRSHPYIDVDAIQKGEPLTILIAAQDLTMAEKVLWNDKIRPFLDLSEWKLERQGNTLKAVTNKVTGDQIIFLSHSDGAEKNRKHMQGYVANYVWLDEMPTSPAILEELQLRIQSKGKQNKISGLLATFTPKFRSDKIRRIIDGAEEPFAKKYRMSKFDNPLFADSLDEEMSRLQGYSESERRTILYGEWSTGDNAVYKFDYETMTVDSMPGNYHSGWRHVESVDPALRSKCGYTLWAEDPNTGTWYLINDKYVQGDETLDPEQLFHIINKRSSGYNLCRRISDTMAWYTSIASKLGVSYVVPYDKNSRKEELIKTLQTNLSNGNVKIGKWCGTFIAEVQACQFREDSDKIVNSSVYHTLDCAQYFCDNMPKYDPAKAALPWEVMLHNSHQKRMAAESQALKIQKAQKGTRGRVAKPLASWGSRKNKYRIR